MILPVTMKSTVLAIENAHPIADFCPCHSSKSGALKTCRNDLSGYAVTRFELRYELIITIHK
jgi:hypothetical protein